MIEFQLSVAAAELAASLTNFPVCVKIGTASGKRGQNMTSVFDEIGASYLKMGIYLADRTTPCYCEVVSWDNVGRTAELHFLAPSLSNAAENRFYLRADASFPNNAYTGTVGSAAGKAVWDANFKCVYHMNDVTTSTIADSTGLNIGNKVAANEPVEAAGLAGKAQSFDGTNDAVNIDAGGAGDPLNITGGQVTLEALVNRTGNNPTATQGFIIEKGWGDKMGFRVNNGGALWVTFLQGAYPDALKLAYTFSSAVLSNGVPAHAAITFNRPAVKAFIDGLEKQSTSWDYDIVSYNGTSHIGGWDHGYGFNLYFYGLIDEVRVSNIDRGTAWLAATNKTLRDTLLDITPAIHVVVSGGQAEPYITFDSGYAYCAVTSVFDPSLSNFSAEIWFRIPNGYVEPTDWQDGLLGCANFAAPRHGWFLAMRTAKYVGNEGKVGFWMGMNSTYGLDFVNSLLPLNDGNWHLADITVNRAAYAKLYIDGAFNTQADISSYSAIDNYGGVGLGIGTASYTTGKLKGDLQKGRFYSRELSATEVAQHYRGIYLDETGLEGKWLCNEKTGGTLVDSAGSSRNATLVATYAWPNLRNVRFRITG